ncbi:MAG: Hsp20/alpha crystallin family protein [Candidatus Colwellbacteria bacterium]|nr:Hsp20/alpha crystallin family protein [Candidatus Colwellbacteria bacterium]MBI3088751.1 Hsp20/alpha crystallin family protein [Candidatus Colwellbacteria bacterium]
MFDKLFGKPGKLETRKARNKEREVPETGIAEEMEGQLAIDVYQTPDEIVVESTIAGVKIADIDIDVSAEKVTIRGERHRDSKIMGHDYFWQECFWGKFSRSVILPEEIDPDKAHFTLKRGVLTIYLPKVHKDRVRKITGREIKDD